MARPSFRKLHVRWRDPRFVGGLALVALSAAAGGYLLAGPATHPVYRAQATILPGTRLAEAKIELVDVPTELAGAYVGPGELDADGAVVAQTIRKGELLGADAFSQSKATGTRMVLPLAVAAPSDVSEGDRVSLWTVSRSGASGEEGGAVELTDDALVVALNVSDSLGASAASAEVVVPDDAAARILALLGADSLFVITSGGPR